MVSTTLARQFWYTSPFIPCIIAFGLDLGYDLLEGRRTIYVIITKFSPHFFWNKMTETFETLEDVLHEWAQDDIKESLAQASTSY